MSLSLEAVKVARSLPVGAQPFEVLRAAYAAVPEAQRRSRWLKPQRRIFYRLCLSKHAILAGQSQESEQ